MQSISLFELNEHIRRVLALNFSEAIWVRAEVGQLKNSRGHFFFSLIEKSESNEQVVAKAEAALWQSQYNRLRRQYGKKQLDELLQENIELLLKLRVDFHEQYGLKLIIEDIDPTYTHGKLALQRQAVLEKLHKKNYLNKNSRLTLPPVVQNIAILSNEQAAGYHDFVMQLGSNKFEYDYELTLFPIALQGAAVERELLAQIGEISKSKGAFDCIVLVRGGGSKLDLAAFDSYEVAVAIAKSKLPVLTGIGHEIDESIADVVAHTALKTPTAVAEFLINHAAEFEQNLINHWYEIADAGSKMIHASKMELEALFQTINTSAKYKLNLKTQLLDFIKQEVPILASRKLKDASLRLENLSQLCVSLSPKKVLERGYSITEKNGAILTDANQAAKGDLVKSHLKRGIIISKVEK